MIDDNKPKRVHSPETKEKMRQAALKRGKRSEEDKAKMSAGRNAWLATLTLEERHDRAATYGMLGKTQKPASRKQIGESQKGKIIPDYQKELQSKAAKTRWEILTTSEKRILTEKAKIVNTGSKRTSETKAKMSVVNRKWWDEATEEQKEERYKRLRSMKGEQREFALGLRGFTSIENKVNSLLEDSGIPFMAQKALGPYVVDFFLPISKLVLEVNGCYWHGCVTCGRLEENKVNQQRDKRKASWLRNHGYKLVVIWEHEINAAGFTLKERIT